VKGRFATQHCIHRGLFDVSRINEENLIQGSASVVNQSSFFAFPKLASHYTVKIPVLANRWSMNSLILIGDKLSAWSHIPKHLFPIDTHFFFRCQDMLYILKRLEENQYKRMAINRELADIIF
jgi:hypothetical protein